METILDVENSATISGIVLIFPKLIKHPKLEEVDVVEGTQMEDLIEMENEEEDVEQLVGKMAIYYGRPLAH